MARNGRLKIKYKIRKTSIKIRRIIILNGTMFIPFYNLCQKSKQIQNIILTVSWNYKRNLWINLKKAESREGMKNVLFENSKIGVRVLMYAAAIALIAIIVLLNGCGIEKTDNKKINNKKKVWWQYLVMELCQAIG